MSFLRNIFSTISTEIILKIVGAFTTIFIARMLPVKEYGQFALFLTIVNAIVAFSAFGLPQAIIFYVGKKKIAYNDLLKAVLFLWFLIILISTLLFIILNNSYLATKLVSTVILFIIPYFLIKLLDYLLLSLLRGFNKFLLFNSKRLIDAIFIIFFLLLLNFKALVSLQNIIVIHIIANLSTTVFLLVYLLVKKEKAELKNEKGLLRTSRELLKFGLKSYLQMLVSTLNYQISIFILALFLASSDIAVFSIAFSFASLIWFIPNTIGLVLLPQLSSYKDDRKIHETTTFIYRNILNLTFIGSIIFAISANWLIPLFYGFQYNVSVIPALILLPGIIGMALYKILTRNFTSRNKQQISIKTAVIVLILNNVLNLLLVPNFGITGAAVASSIAFIAAGSLLTYFFIIDSKQSLHDLLFIKKSDIQIYKDLLRKVFIHK